MCAAPTRRSVQLPDEQPGLQQPAPGPPFWPTAGWSILTCNSRETTYFKQIRPGTYQFYLAETNLLPHAQLPGHRNHGLRLHRGGTPFSALASLQLESGAQVHLHPVCPQRGSGSNEIQTLVVTDR